ncbi:MAG: PTS fructose transporter subunit IIA [Rhodoferax sp.]|nr:PTS fructose transporter subunit IIA [Rhodoferax sp.]
MTNAILIIAHSPLASALRQCVLHVFPDAEPAVLAVDVRSGQSFDQSLAAARQALSQLHEPNTLVLTDVFGATPCNVAQKLVDGVAARLVAGVNLPMLLRAVTYRREPLEVLVARAMAGGTQGVMQVATAAPQNQAKKKNDQDHHDHQQ